MGLLISICEVVQVGLIISFYKVGLVGLIISHSKVDQVGLVISLCKVGHGRFNTSVRFRIFFEGVLRLYYMGGFME